LHFKNDAPFDWDKIVIVLNFSGTQGRPSICGTYVYNIRTQSCTFIFDHILAREGNFHEDYHWRLKHWLCKGLMELNLTSNSQKHRNIDNFILSSGWWHEEREVREANVEVTMHTLPRWEAVAGRLQHTDVLLLFSMIAAVFDDLPAWTRRCGALGTEQPSDYALASIAGSYNLLRLVITNTILQKIMYIQDRNKPALVQEPTERSFYTAGLLYERRQWTDQRLLGAFAQAALDRILDAAKVKRDTAAYLSTIGKTENDLTVSLRQNSIGWGIYANRDFNKGDVVAYYKMRVYSTSSTTRPKPTKMARGYANYAIEMRSASNRALGFQIEGNLAPECMQHPGKSGVPYWGFMANEPFLKEEIAEYEEGMEHDEQLNGNVKLDYDPEYNYALAGRQKIEPGDHVRLLLRAKCAIDKHEAILWCYGKQFDRSYPTPCGEITIDKHGNKIMKSVRVD